MATGFIWYELMTTDIAAAEKFYPAVIGWTTQEFPQPDMRYVVVNAGETGVGGLMTIPKEAAAMGAVPAWIGYIKSRDIDGDAAAVAKAGGNIHRPPQQIPGVGQFSLVADPQGAMYMLLQPNGADQAPAAPMTPGHVGWVELMADNWEKAFDYYAGLYGWTRGMAVEMGEMGTYQTFMQTETQGGGMMNRMANTPVNWGFYFVVEGIDAAAKRVTDNGGQVIMGPHQVPGGQWIANCLDPQGAYFGLLSNTK
jgi:predicted enzyme related to lactoylglutathione lyase